MVRRSLPRLILLFSLLLSGGLLPVSARGALPPGTAHQDAGPAGRESVRLLSSTQDELVFTVDVPWQQLSLEPMTEDGAAYVQVRMPGLGASADAGTPELPLVAESIGAPHGADVSVSVMPGTAHRVPLPALPVPVARLETHWPLPGEAATAELLPDVRTVREPDWDIYGGDVPYPSELGRILADGLVRQQRVVGLALSPVQYDPTLKQLLVYESLRVTVRFEGDSASPARSPVNESPVYEDLLNRSLLNAEVARGWRHSAETDGPSAIHSAQPLALPWAPPDPGWRIRIAEEGMYRLTYSEMAAAGLPVDSLDPTTLQLFAGGEQVAIRVEGELDGHLDPSDAVLFYGVPVASKYAAGGVYWLTCGAAPGLRMAEEDAAPTTGTAVLTYDGRWYGAVSGRYFTWLPGDDDTERWLWDYVFRPSRPNWSPSPPIQLTAPASGGGSLELTLYGYNDVDHHARVSLNSTVLGDVEWNGIGNASAEFVVPDGLLQAGDNPLLLTAIDDTGYSTDIIYIDSVDVRYPSLLVAGADTLRFAYDTPGTWVYPVGGFGTSEVTVFDVSEPGAVVRLTNPQIEAAGGAYTTAFQDTITAHTLYWLGTEAAYLAVESIEQDAPSDLQSAANGADHIIITHSAFMVDALRLSEFRDTPDLRSIVVDVQDIYDEFGYGVGGVAPIHDFLAYAYANWQPPAPAYVLLVGDGHYDPKGYLASSTTNYIPAWLADVDPLIGETAADNRFVTIVGSDVMPDMMIGRLAVNSFAEASAYVDKLIAYEADGPLDDWERLVLAVADDPDDGGAYVRLSDDLLDDLLPDDYTAEKIYLYDTHPTAAAAKVAILAGFNTGRFLINYIGHAGYTQWADEAIFSATDVASLSNAGMYPVILAMTCYDGFFHRPAATAYATAEVVTRAEDKGAIASWSPTGLGYASDHDYLNRGFFEETFEALDGRATLGQATMAGKLKLWATGGGRDLIDTYMLFGDPATTLSVVPAWHYLYLPLIWR